MSLEACPRRLLLLIKDGRPRHREKQASAAFAETQLRQRGVKDHAFAGCRGSNSNEGERMKTRRRPGFTAVIQNPDSFAKCRQTHGTPVLETQKCRPICSLILVTRPFPSPASPCSGPISGDTTPAQLCRH